MSIRVIERLGAWRATCDVAPCEGAGDSPQAAVAQLFWILECYPAARRYGR